MIIMIIMIILIIVIIMIHQGNMHHIGQCGSGRDLGLVPLAY